jgi:hypothetical protein
LSILNEEEDWKPAIMFKKDKVAYERKIRSIVRDNPAN